MIDIELTGLEELKKKLDPKAADIISMRTINRIGAMAKTEAYRAITADHDLKHKAEFKEKLKFYKSSMGENVAFIKVKNDKDRYLSLVKWFVARKVKGSGVKFNVRKGESANIKYAFIATMRNGMQGVFIRKNKNSRLPIRHVAGPSPTQLMGRIQTLDAIRKLIRDEFFKRFQHERKFYFDSITKKLSKK